MIPFFVFFLLFTSCTYHWYPENGRPTVLLPFVSGDEEGALTQAIARALSDSGVVDLSHAKGDYRLQVSVVDTATEQIGYRRDRQKITGKIKKNLVAAEGRRSLTVEVILYEGTSDRIASGPHQITADADYDFVDGDSLPDLTFVDTAGKVEIVLPFSLGQLESNEAAYEAASSPLYAKLARKIVETVFLGLKHSSQKR